VYLEHLSHIPPHRIQVSLSLRAENEARCEAYVQEIKVRLSFPV
jgi:hypothetical protein